MLFLVQSSMTGILNYSMELLKSISKVITLKFQKDQLPVLEDCK